MDELRFERQDGDRLILMGPDDQSYQVVVTAELRAAVRLTARPPLPEAVPNLIPEDLKPRDIQALVRAGADPTELANVTKTKSEHVLRYAAPVMDERTYVAERARLIEIRHQEDSATLEQLAIERLASRGVDPLTMEWDAYYTAGCWVARLDFELAEVVRTARWNVDLAGRRLAPLDEPAEWITEPGPPDGPVPPPRRHLTAVASQADQRTGPAANAQQDSGPAPGAAAEASQLSLLDDLMDARGLREPVSLDLKGEPITAEPAQVFELRRPPPQAPGQGSPDLPPYSAYTLEDASAAETDAGGTERISLRQRAADLPPVLATGNQPPAAPPDTPTPVEGTELVPPVDPPDKTKTTRASRPRAKRSSVPSWDEIVFGASRSPED